MTTWNESVEAMRRQRGQIEQESFDRLKAAAAERDRDLPERVPLGYRTAEEVQAERDAERDHGHVAVVDFDGHGHRTGTRKVTRTEALRELGSA